MYENNYPNNTYHYDTSHAGNENGRTDQFGSAYGQGAMGGTYGRNTPEPKKSFGAGKKIAVALCCGLCFGIFAGMGFFAVTTAGNILGERLSGKSETKQVQEVPQADLVPEKEMAETEETKPDTLAQTQTSPSYAAVTDVTEVVKAVMPSVVSINNRYVERMSFFGQEYSSEARSAGSGFIVGQNDTELLLVSNQHVVAQAEELTVQFVDGTQAQAQIKGVDIEKDLAVIAVQLADIGSETMDSIVVAKLGDSDSLTVGEPAIAIGNALGYGQSVTTGVVSALNRAIPASDGELPDMTSDVEINTFIQTDAAINPGNSGGALLNMQGEVIGINSNKIGGSAVEGMGYAIPISDVKPIIENLMSKETRARVAEDKRGYLGITGLDVKADDSESYGIPQGAYVSSVVEGGPADRAGIARGYIITALNGEEIGSMSELKEELSYYAAGDTVELTVMRMVYEGYEEAVISVTLGKQMQ
ncbi:MAG: trypsin-like peptidase domain-containing protein [Lachnospiraceae bacterium]|nr:trypsin-like peptidase domain-containing protein [Lachnospiraceae bacterium]